MADFFYGEGMATTFGELTEPQYVVDQERNRVIVVVHGRDLNPYVVVYNPGSDSWSAPVQVGTSDLSDDDHGVPAISQDDNGFYHVVFGQHSTLTGGDLQHAISTNANDPYSWDSRPNIADLTTYPVFYNVGGDLVIIHRYDQDPRPTAVHRSTDNGSTWSRSTLVESFPDSWNYHYANYRDGDDIHLGIVIRDTAAGIFRDLYHVIYDAGADTLRSVGGTSLSKPATTTELNDHCRAIDADGTYSANLTLDENGNPHFIVAQDVKGTFEWRYVYWDGRAWTSPTTITTKGNEYGEPEIVSEGSGNFRAWLKTNSSERGGDIEEWTYDGSSWTQDSVIYDASTRPEGAANPKFVPEMVDIEVLFGQRESRDAAGGADYTNNDLQAFAWDGAAYTGRVDTTTSQTDAGARQTSAGGAISTDGSGVIQTTSATPSEPAGALPQSFEEADVLDAFAGDKGAFSLTNDAYDGSQALEATASEANNAIVTDDETVAQGDTLEWAVQIQSTSWITLLFGAQQAEGVGSLSTYRATVSLDNGAFQGPGKLQLSKVVNGSYTPLNAYTDLDPPTGTYILPRVEWGTDDSITFTLNDQSGTQIGQSVSVTDSEFTSGFYGVLVYNGTSQLDDIRLV